MKRELDFIGISFLSFGETPVNIPRNFHYAETCVPVEPCKYEGTMQDGAIWNAVTPSLVGSCKIITNIRLVYSCAKPLNSDLSTHSLPKTLMKILGFSFVYLLFKLSPCWYHSLPGFFSLWLVGNLAASTQQENKSRGIGWAAIEIPWRCPLPCKIISAGFPFFPN